LKRLIEILKKDSVMSLAGNLLTAGLGFINFAALARILSKEDFGAWVFYLTLVGLFEMIRAGFLRTPVIRNIFEEEAAVVGSAWFIGLLFSFLIISINVVLLVFFPDFTEHADLTLFAYWFSWLSIGGLPTYFTFWIKQAQSRFDQILINRLIQLVPYTGTLVYFFFFEDEININTIALVHLITNSIAGVFTLFLGWSGIQHIFHTSKAWIIKIYHFGKYTVGSVIGTNLLKSSDTFLINYFLGQKALAIYAVPYKVIEIIEIPIRSYVATILPQMAKSHATGKGNQHIAELFTKNVGFLTVAIIPILLGIFIFAQPVVNIIGGEAYSTEATLILRIFVVYGFFLAVDRFTGITLDAINQPRYNFIKMVMMVTANVIFDLIALYTIGELWAVSAVTIITILVGVVTGNNYIRKQVPIQFSRILPEGFAYWKSLIKSNLNKT
tara:strand:+ start:7980 stop:9302 length:1323 start_codon:yes stop_codon:yes gene_type:complete